MIPYKLKPEDDPDLVAYKDALKELVTSISIVHFLGKTLENFEHPAAAN